MFKLRNKKKDKRKNTFNKYGKNTKKGLRIKLNNLFKRDKNKKVICKNNKIKPL